MSSPPTTTIMQTSNKRNASSLKPKTDPKTRKNTKKATISYSPPPPPRDDFILFPDTRIIENHALDRRARARRVREDLVSDGLLPLTREDRNADQEKLTPLQRAAKRRNRVEHLPVIHQSEKMPQLSNTQLPPAPSPPRLGTPDLDDVDEDLWSCCSWGESSVESYKTTSKQSQGTFSFFMTKNEIHKLTNRQKNRQLAVTKPKHCHFGIELIFDALIRDPLMDNDGTFSDR